MREDDDKYRVYLDAQPGQDFRETRPIADLPFCLGIFGDFSGRGSLSSLAGGEDWASRPLVRVTPENVLNFGGLSPKAEVRGLPGTVSTASLVFDGMDDFHPDSLFRRLDLFRDFRLARERILGGEGPAGLEGTGAEDGSTGTVSGEGAGRGAESAAPGLLDAILQETNQEALQDGSDLEGDLDLQAFLGLSEKMRPGYEGIHLTYRVECDAPREKILELCEYVQKTSPVLDILRNPVPVTVSLEN